MAVDPMGMIQAELATRNVDNPDLIKSLVDRARGLLEGAQYGATAFGQPTSNQSSPSGGRATAYPVQSGGTESPDQDLARANQVVGLGKLGTSLATSIPWGVGNAISQVPVPGVEGSSAAGTLSGALGVGTGALNFANGDIPRGFLNTAQGGLNLAQGLGYSVPYGDLAGGALGLGSGALTLAEGGNEGAGLTQLVGGALSLAGVPVIGQLLAAGVAGDQAFNDRYSRLAREASRVRNAGEVYEPLAQAFSSGDIQGGLSGYAPGGQRYGDILQGMLRSTLQGNEGWVDPYQFQSAFGWEPTQSYRGLAGLLGQMGYTPANELAPGTNLAELASWTGKPHQEEANAGNWKAMLDALAPFGAGYEGRSPFAIAPGAQAAYGAYQERKAGERARSDYENRLRDAYMRQGAGSPLSAEDAAMLSGWFANNPQVEVGG